MDDFNPLRLFPREIWEKLFDKLDDSQDIICVLEAFPILHDVFYYEKPLWAFGKIVPFLIKWDKWISKNDLTNCRSVYKRWAKSVDNFLETQDKHSPFLPEDIDREIVAETISCHVDRESYRLDKKIGFSKSIRLVKIYEFEQAQKIARWMEDQPPETNPFPGRALTLTMYRRAGGCSCCFIEKKDNVVKYWEEILDLIRQVGHHIWHVEFHPRAEFNYPFIFWASFLECLELMPNLKSFGIYLELNMYFGAAELREFTDMPFPDLPHLESLALNELCERIPPLLARATLTRYSHQLKDLQLQLQFWEDEFATLFPNLVQLKVTGIKSKEKLDSLLMSIDSPLLAKIELNLEKYREGQLHSFTVEEFFPWLKRFPRLKVFALSQSEYYSKIKGGTLDPSKDSIESLEFLKLFFSFDMDYSFLLCFPNLKHLVICTEPEPYVVDPARETVIKIRDQIQTGLMYSSNIWEVLPKLKTIRLKMTRERVDFDVIHDDYNFNRGGCHQWKMNKDKDIPSPRPDLQKFLDRNTMILKWMETNSVYSDYIEWID